MADPRIYSYVYVSMRYVRTHWIIQTEKGYENGY